MNDTGKDIKHNFSSSLGVAFYPEHGGSAAELLKVAEEAMYESKNRGGDSYSVAKL